jgi:hypothetical protein
MKSKFLAGSGFLHGKASLTAAILWDMARGTFTVGISLRTIFSLNFQM